LNISRTIGLHFENQQPPTGPKMSPGKCPTSDEME